MDQIATMTELLLEKEGYFAQYEQITQEMLVCPQGELEEMTEQRQKLIGRIDRLQQTMEEQVAALGEDAPAAKNALRLSCHRSELPEALYPLFDRSQQIAAIIHRIERGEPLVVDRIEEELERLSEKIKETNRSIPAKAARYQINHEGLGQGAPLGKA